MATPLKFRALGAKIMDDDKFSRCRVSVLLRAGAPDRDEAAWLPVDLWRTPSKRPDDPWFDDRGLDKDGKPLAAVAAPKDLAGIGVTSLGPLGATPRMELGGVYARHDKFLAWYDVHVFDPKLPTLPWKPADWFNYELTSYLSASGHRYHGFHARVSDLAGGVTLELFDAAGRTTKIPFAKITVQVGVPEQADFAVEADLIDLRNAGSGREEMLRPAGLKVDAVGGVYLNLQHLAASGVVGIPKIPIGLGV